MFKTFLPFVGLLTTASLAPSLAWAEEKAAKEGEDAPKEEAPKPTEGPGSNKPRAITNGLHEFSGLFLSKMAKKKVQARFPAKFPQDARKELHVTLAYHPLGSALSQTVQRLDHEVEVKVIAVVSDDKAQALTVR